MAGGRTGIIRITNTEVVDGLLYLVVLRSEEWEALEPQAERGCAFVKRLSPEVVARLWPGLNSEPKAAVDAQP